MAPRSKRNSPSQPASSKRSPTGGSVRPRSTIRRPRFCRAGLPAKGLPVKLYFDPSSGLLVRLIYYSDTPVGIVPIQIDYSNLPRRLRRENGFSLGGHLDRWPFHH